MWSYVKFISGYQTGTEPRQDWNIEKISIIEQIDQLLNPVQWERQREKLNYWKLRFFECRFNNWAIEKLNEIQFWGNKVQYWTFSSILDDPNLTLIESSILQSIPILSLTNAQDSRASEQYRKEQIISWDMNKRVSRVLVISTDFQRRFGAEKKVLSGWHALSEKDMESTSTITRWLLCFCF